MARSLQMVSGLVLVVPILVGASAPQGPSQDVVRAALEQTLAQRVDAVDGKSTTASVTALSASPSFATEQAAALQELKTESVQTIASGRSGLVNGSAEVSDIKTSMLPDGRAKVTNTEVVRFDFADKKSATDFTAERYVRESMFVLINGSWVMDETSTTAGARPYLSADGDFRLQDPPRQVTAVGPEPTDTSGQQSGGTSRSTTTGGTTASTQGMSSAYTAHRADFVSYMAAHAYNYNSAYRSFNSDCTNFVSQAELAAGFPMVGFKTSETASNVWWYDHEYIDEWSHTWSVADDHYWFLRSTGRAALYSSSASLTNGDIVAIDLNPTSGVVDHMVGVTKKDGGTTYVSGHTSDYYNKWLGTVIDSNPGSQWRYTHLWYT